MLLGLWSVLVLRFTKLRMHRFLKILVVAGLLVASGLSTSEDESPDAQPIRVDAMFALMSNQIVDVVCDAPDFRACFDVPYAECSRNLRKMLADCRLEMNDELPDLIRSDDADPIIEKTYDCVIPKWNDLIKDRRTETQECLRIEAQAERGEES